MKKTALLTLLYIISGSMIHLHASISDDDRERDIMREEQQREGIDREERQREIRLKEQEKQRAKAQTRQEEQMKKSAQQKLLQEVQC